MKNTWLYEKLEKLIRNDSIFNGEFKSNFLENIVNIILLPLIGLTLMFLALLSILLLPLYLIKDFVDLYYYINAEKIEAKRKAKEALEKQQKVEDYINYYQQVVDRYPVYILKQFKIKEKKSESQLNNIEYGSFNQKYPTIRRRNIQQNNHYSMIYTSQQNMNIFHDALRQQYENIGISDQTRHNDSYYKAKNDRNKEYVELSIEEVHQKHEDYIDFIRHFMFSYNFNCDTFNLKTGQRVCDSNRRRSAFDIYLITKYYYNHVTFQDVLFTLVDLVEKYDLYTSYCSDVHKYVYYTLHTSIHNRLDRNLEFSSELTFVDLMKYKQLIKNN